MADILLIDDEAQMRRMIVRVLNAAGHTVREAADGRVGIELFRDAVPALVITDIVMPDMEGIELIRELRRLEPSVPILAISGGGPALYLRAAIELGATASLAKPFDGDAMLTLVEKLLDPT